MGSSAHRQSRARVVVPDAKKDDESYRLRFIPHRLTAGRVFGAHVALYSLTSSIE